MRLTFFSHRGPLDVLDHSSDSFSFGGKAGIDATIKLPEENRMEEKMVTEVPDIIPGNIPEELNVPFIKGFNLSLIDENIRVIILSVNPSEDSGCITKVCELLKKGPSADLFRLVIIVDHTVDTDDLFMVTWQVLGNSDPLRDHYFVSNDTILIDGTIKHYRKGGFPRRWPNIVCSDSQTIEKTDKKWETYGFDSFIPSPSLRNTKLNRGSGDFIDVKQNDNIP